MQEAVEETKKEAQTFVPMNASIIFGVEGIDGCGKDTVCKMLAEAFAKHGIEAVILADMDSTELGKKTRGIFLDKESTLNPTSEMMLISAARYENMVKNVAPLITAGKVIIMNRTADSTLVYNGMVRGGDIGTLDVTNSLVHGVAGQYKPALTLYIDTPVDVAMDRVNARGGEKDGFEMKPIEWFKQIEAGYSFLRASRPFDYVVIKNDKGLDELSKIIENTVTGFLMRTLGMYSYITNEHIKIFQDRLTSEAGGKVADLQKAADDLQKLTSENE